MIHYIRATRFPARWFMLARDTFEASVATHYAAPWQHSPSARAIHFDQAA